MWHYQVVSPAPAGAKAEAPEAAREQHPLMEMALTLLLQAINKSSRNRIDVRDAGMLAMLGGLLPFLVRAMRSRHSAVASTALRIFSVLVPLPLPGGCPQGLHHHAQNANTAVWAKYSHTHSTETCMSAAGLCVQQCYAHQLLKLKGFIEMLVPVTVS